MEAAPNVNTSYKVASHAHPLPALPSSRVLKEKRLQVLTAQQSINVHLHGLPFGRAPSVTDVLMPKVHRSVFNENVNPHNLDVISCWKGLTHAQSTELAMWYRLLYRSLHDEVLMRLRENLVEDLLQSKETLDEVYLVPRILDCLRSKPHRLIDVSFVNLIDSMLSMFHERCSDGMPATNSTACAFHLSGGLSRFLDKFLRAQDCFVSGHYLEIDFDFQYTQTVLKATGEVNWQLPDVRFLPLPERLSPGEEYCITPFMPSDALGTQQVIYSITRSSLRFHWDHSKQYFKSTVPEYADEEDHVAETVLAATMTTLFPGHVRFERECRWSIRLDITPTRNRHERSVSAIETVELLREASWSVDRNSNTRSLYSESPQLVSPQSLQKRRGSEPELVPRAVDFKRRRYCCADQAEHESLVYLHGGISIPTDRVSVEEMTDRTCPGQLGLDRDHACRHISVAAANRQPAQNDSLLHVLATAEPKIQASRLSVATDDGTLQQQQIMRNYQEFAQRKSLRDAGLASPISDGERRAFESIFLQEDSVWSPVTEGNAVEFDSGMGDA